MERRKRGETEKLVVNSHWSHLQVTWHSLTHSCSLSSAQHLKHSPPLVSPSEAVSEKMIQVPFSHPSYRQGNPNVLLMPAAPGSKTCLQSSVRTLNTLLPRQGETHWMPVSASKTESCNLRLWFLEKKILFYPDRFQSTLLLYTE